MYALTLVQQLKPLLNKTFPRTAKLDVVRPNPTGGTKILETDIKCYS